MMFEMMLYLLFCGQTVFFLTNQSGPFNLTPHVKSGPCFLRYSSLWSLVKDSYLNKLVLPVEAIYYNEMSEFVN